MMNSNQEGLHKLLSGGVSSAVVAAMDELKIVVALWNAITSQVLDIEHRVDPKIAGNIELVGAETKPP